MTNSASRTAVWGGALLLIIAALYLFTLDNGLRPDELTGGDLITHQYAQVEARPGNAPGYPLYTIGGWLWFRLGRTLFGWGLNPIQILSLYSTLWALAALWVLYLILHQVSNRQRPVALLLTAFYAVTYFFWYYSVTTEQYTSAVLQTLLVIWLALKWDESPRDSLLLWLAFICGTMLANMVTTLFILPPLVWFIFSRRVSPDDREFLWYHYLKKPKFILLAVGLTCLPLFSYAYVYLRGVLHPEWRGEGQWPNAWTWFVQFLTIRQGRDELAPGLTLQNFFTGEFPSLLWQELTGLVFWIGLVGLAFLGRRRAIFLYSTLVIYFVFSWSYRFGNWFQVIIPAYPIFIIGFAAGITRIGEWANYKSQFVLHPFSFVQGKPSFLRLQSFRFLRPGQAFILLLLIGLLVYRFTTNLPRANQHNLPADTGLDPGWAILADNPVTPAIISGDFAERVALQYLTTVWGAAANLYPTVAGDFSPPPGVDNTELAVYISRRAAAMGSDAILGRYPQAAGEQLIALWPAPRTDLPAGVAPLEIDLGEQLRLVGWEQIDINDSLPAGVDPLRQRSNWQLALYWQTREKLSVDYTISVRPLVGGQVISRGGENIIQDHPPVWGIYPTSRWVAGEIVRDVYAFSLPEGSIPEAAQIVVYWATGTGFKNLADTVIYLE